MLTKEKSLLLINKEEADFSLTTELGGKGVYLATLTFSDEYNSYRYIGDAY